MVFESNTFSSYEQLTKKYHATLYSWWLSSSTQVSTAAKSLCMWARAMYTYDKVAKNIGPKKEALAQAEGELEVVQSELGKKQGALRKVNIKTHVIQQDRVYDLFSFVQVLSILKDMYDVHTSVESNLAPASRVCAFFTLDQHLHVTTTTHPCMSRDTRHEGQH